MDAALNPHSLSGLPKKSDLMNTDQTAAVLDRRSHNCVCRNGLPYKHASPWFKIMRNGRSVTLYIRAGRRAPVFYVPADAPHPLARGSRDPDQTRRLLALAVIVWRVLLFYAYKLGRARPCRKPPRALGASRLRPTRTGERKTNASNMAVPTLGDVP
jgi:hypothetical protein